MARGRKSPEAAADAAVEHATEAFGTPLNGTSHDDAPEQAAAPAPTIAVANDTALSEEDAVSAALDEFLGAIDDTVEIAAKTLTGDLRDIVLELLRHEQNKRPWFERSESEQRDTVQRVTERVHAAVAKAVELMATGGRKVIPGRLENIKVSDKIVAQIVVMRNVAERHLLTDAVGSMVLLSVVDVHEFTGERAPVAIKPDQGDLVVLANAGVVHSAAEDNHASAETPFE